LILNLSFDFIDQQGKLKGKSAIYKVKGNREVKNPKILNLIILFLKFQITISKVKIPLKIVLDKYYQKYSIYNSNQSKRMRKNLTNKKNLIAHLSIKKQKFQLKNSTFLKF
jgi:hypothetical protein